MAPDGGEATAESANPPTEYYWDVFISYRREPAGTNLITPWIRAVVDRVKLWLSDELPGRPPRVFFDRDSIRVGDLWPDTLRRAIRTSRCMVALLSPQYFHQPWCVAEWTSFLTRQHRLAQSRTPIIAPVRVHDGDWFPADAIAVQALDLSDHVGTTPAFWHTARADELDQMLRPFTRRVGQLVKNAPPFSADWPIEEPEPAKPPSGFERRGL
jgi:hypothetical protein